MNCLYRFDTLRVPQENNRNHPDGHGPDEPTVWASKPMKIGKHEWRVLVYQNKLFGRCTHYEFRGPRAELPRIALLEQPKAVANIRRQPLKPGVAQRPG